MKTSLSSVPPVGLSLAAAVAGLAAPSLPAAAAPAPGARVVTVVKVARPWYAPRFVLVRKFRETIPQYQAIAGLEAKAYTLAPDGHFGGIYLWQDRAAANSWFNEAWFARVQAQRGVPGEVRYFDAPVVLDAGGTLGEDGRAVATLALRPATGASRADLIAGFQASREADRSLPGLLRRCYVIAADGRAGSISLWTDAAAARRHHGNDPAIETFEAPLVIRAKALTR